jgi:ABC-type Fe3+/spermidine/putrescine transport system ATPase subunit
MGAVLTVDGIRHRRGGREVLQVPRLEIGSGERLGLLGRNGAGKTTLLRLLAGIDEPTAGEVRIDGVVLSRGAAVLRRRLAYAPQRPVLLSTSVRHNVELPLRYRRAPRATRRTTAEAALARLGVEHLADRAARTLSGGEAQRVSLARALACSPDGLLLDEPAAGLDTPARAAFFADVDQALGDRTTTVVLVSHRAEEVLARSDRVAVLVDGELRQEAPGADLVASPADAAVARLVGYENVVDVQVDAHGRVLLGGRPTGLTATAGPRPATLAVWAAAVHVRPGGEGSLAGRVASVTTGPGRREVTLDAGVTLQAHLPLTTARPEPGADVAIELDPAVAVILDHRPVTPRGAQTSGMRP